MPVNQTHYVGKAGEHMVAAQLLMRGIPVSFPAVDDGADLYAGHLRIQVKSARKICPKSLGSLGYHFNLGVSTWNPATRSFYKAKDSRRRVDFYVFWGIDENRFWVVPAHLLGYNAVRIVEGSKRYTVNSDDALALLNAGLNQKTVAQRLGVSTAAVNRVANGALSKTKPGRCHEVLKRENAWHEITSALGLVNSIETQLQEELV